MEQVQLTFNYTEKSDTTLNNVRWCCIILCSAKVLLTGQSDMISSLNSGTRTMVAHCWA